MRPTFSKFLIQLIVSSASDINNYFYLIFKNGRISLKRRRREEKDKIGVFEEINYLKEL